MFCFNAPCHTIRTSLTWVYPGRPRRRLAIGRLHSWRNARRLLHPPTTYYIVSIVNIPLPKSFTRRCLHGELTKPLYDQGGADLPTLAPPIKFALRSTGVIRRDCFGFGLRHRLPCVSSRAMSTALLPNHAAPVLNSAATEPRFNRVSLTSGMSHGPNAITVSSMGCFPYTAARRIGLASIVPNTVLQICASPRRRLHAPLDLLDYSLSQCMMLQP